MRLALIASSLSAVIATAAVAATGDALVVTGDGVNVRSQPSSSGSIVLQVYRDEPATELAREGDWVEVQLTDRGTRGWIHQSLLAPKDAPAAAAEPAPSPPSQAPVPALPSPEAASPQPAAPEPAPPAPQPPVTAAAPAPTSPSTPPIPGTAGPDITPGGVALGDSSAFGEFRKSVRYLNNRALTAAGVDLFTDVRSVGDGAVQVVTTDAWETVPQAGQQSYLNALFNSWLLVAGPDGERTVQILDPDGDLVMEKSGP